MLKKRIIPCLDVRNGMTVKEVNFVRLVDVGDPFALARVYADGGADELVFLDITATVEKRKTLVDLVERTAREIAIPFTVGGGVSTVEDAAALLEAGADKIAVNSAAVRSPGLITDLAHRFGSQAVVLAVDAGMVGNEWRVHVDGGRTPLPLNVVEWTVRGTDLGAGEILLTSIEHDGMGTGFCRPLIEQVRQQVPVPIIASGGAGEAVHFRDIFREGGADAALAAGVFHFGRIRIPMLKAYLKKEGIAVR